MLAMVIINATLISTYLFCGCVLDIDGVMNQTLDKRSYADVVRNTEHKKTDYEGTYPRTMADVNEMICAAIMDESDEYAEEFPNWPSLLSTVFKAHFQH
jgi:hypothetical protein